jgi:hypothetical protein
MSEKMPTRGLMKVMQVSQGQVSGRTSKSYTSCANGLRAPKMEDIFLSCLEVLLYSRVGLLSCCAYSSPRQLRPRNCFTNSIIHLGRDTKIRRGQAFKARSTKDIKVMPKRTISHCCRSWMLGEEVTIRPPHEATRNQFSAPLLRRRPQPHA